MLARVRAVTGLRGFCSSIGRAQQAQQADGEAGQEVRPATAQLPGLTDLGARNIFDSEQDAYREQVTSDAYRTAYHCELAGSALDARPARAPADSLRGGGAAE